MYTWGTGNSGLAVLSFDGANAEDITAEGISRIPPVWLGIPKPEIPDALYVNLFRFGKRINRSPEAIREQGEEFRSECRKRKIKVVVAIGAKALAVASPELHGDIRKLIGSTIESNYVQHVIPIDTAFGGHKVFRRYDWIRANARFVKRGLALAHGHGHIFKPPTISTGEGNDVLRALEQIRDDGLPVGVDIESTGKDFRSDLITAMGLGNRDRAVSSPWHGYNSRLYGLQSGLRCSKIRELVLSILADPRITKILHNGLFDISVLSMHGIRVAGPIEDTLLAHKVCHPDLYRNLQFCMSYEFACRPWKTIFDLQRKARKEGDDWSDTKPEPLMVYNAHDAVAEVPLFDRLWERLNSVRSGVANYERLKALAGIAAEMKYHGVRIDLEAVNETKASVQNRIAEVAAEWNALDFGVPISGKGSDTGIRNLFFNELKAPVVSRSVKTELAKLSGAVLLEYASMADHPIAKPAWTLFVHRKIRKSFDAFLKPLNSDRVYATPNPAGTRGSRFAYSDPNLQQWSKAKGILDPFTRKEIELAPNLRNVVCPDLGYVLGESDYNALEVRLVAYAANISVWLDWLARGMDMHSEHVWLMFGRRVGKSDVLRQITKTLTFARFYNFYGSVGQVLLMLKPAMPTLTEAFLLEIFQRFDAARPEIPAWHKRVALELRRYGFVSLPLTGVRQYHDKQRPIINDALSFPIQSTGGDILADAMLRIQPRLDASRGQRILVNVHDALLWQALPEDAATVKNIVTEEMERPVPQLWGHRDVVFPVETKVGPNWRDLKAA